MYNDYYNYLNYSNEYDNYSNRQTAASPLVEMNEGFLRGNMFSNEYEPFTNPIPPEAPRTEKDSLMRRIQVLNFATIDLGMYLDLYSNDSATLNIFNKYNDELNNVTNTYEQKYGPLSFNSLSSDENKWNWPKDPWPWEKEA